MSTSETLPTENSVSAPRRRIPWGWFFLGALVLAVVVGAVAGNFAGSALKSSRQAEDLQAWDTEQFLLAQADYGAGNYSVAMQRLEAVLKNEPDFPDAADLRERVLAAMNATPTPQPTATPIPSPTPDAPRAEQMLAQAKQQFADKNYVEMIKTLLTLKVEIPSFQPERVDGLLWVAYRFNGVYLIKNTNRLAEGMYYLDVAALYAPLDQEAVNEVASAKYFLSVYQSAYYYRNKDIEVSMKNFFEAYSIRPYFTERLVIDYADIIVQNADELVARDACAAWGYYEEALRLVPSHEAAAKGRDSARDGCGQPSPIPFAIGGTPTEG
jgi:tetratricopeptide (TPR) repeat protein